MEIGIPEPGGPAFLYVGGEAELRSSSIGRGEIVTLAQRHNGALFGLEHRFYGASHPFDTLASENMVYLTVEQALEDAATFIAAMTHVHALGDGLWFTVGGSYPAVLSSFMRTKYPHLVAGALASSGPVRADAEFWEYEAVSHSTFCALQLLQTTIISARARAAVAVSRRHSELSHRERGSVSEQVAVRRSDRLSGCLCFPL